MNSMTGQGLGHARTEPLSLTMEARSYNNRYLEVSLSLPGFLRPLEPRFRSAVGGRVRRGRVDLLVQAVQDQRPVTIEVNFSAAAAYRDALRRLAEATGLPDEVRVMDVARLDGVLSVSSDGDAERYWPLCNQALTACLEQLAGARAAEGQLIRADLEQALTSVGELADQIQLIGEKVQARVTQEVRRRLQELMHNDVSDDRVVTAAAVVLSRTDVHEELHRLRAHVSGMQDAITQVGEPNGKRLEFFCQELLREANTLGSKSIEAEVDRRVILLKEQIERLREQVRNVE